MPDERCSSDRRKNYLRPTGLILALVGAIYIITLIGLCETLGGQPHSIDNQQRHLLFRKENGGQFTEVPPSSYWTLRYMIWGSPAFGLLALTGFVLVLASSRPDNNHQSTHK